MQANGSLTLVGAGPGDPGLITLKGIDALKKADIILYDALISPELLKYNINAKQIFVGKRKGQAQTAQATINHLIHLHALEGKHVVRLKGGDPMVFGRAHEELETAKSYNIPTEVIPGISSFTGIAAQHQIPLTKRQEHQSFWVITGHTKKGSFAEDLHLAAKSSATIIILMGMTHLKEIITLFKTYKADDHPIAIVQNGTTPAEKKMVSTIGKILDEKAVDQLQNPAVIFIGYAIREAITTFNPVKNPLQCQL